MCRPEGYSCNFLLWVKSSVMKGSALLTFMEKLVSLTHSLSCADASFCGCCYVDLVHLMTYTKHKIQICCRQKAL